MKKVLLLSAALAVGFTGFSQRAMIKKTEISKQSVLTSVQARQGLEESSQSTNDLTPYLVRPSVSNKTRSMEEHTTMTTYYDLQTNSALGNRIAVWPDGTAAVVATWDNSGATSFTNRGTGYNYFDGSSFGDEPDNRVEPIKSGWPSIAPLGDGEIIVSHTGSTVMGYTRATKGEGEWNQVTVNTNSWPRVATTDNGDYVHVISAQQDASNTLLNYVYYQRSEDGGQTFSDPVYPPLVDLDGEYSNMIGADDYVMATNGSSIAILFGGLTYDLFYIISRDNGETWEKQVVVEFPYEGFNWNQTAVTSATDSIWWCDNSHNIAIDNNGTVHVTFALTRWAPAPESGAGYYSYWPYTDAIVYWNSEFVNEQGGHEIPMFGEWSGDEEFGYMTLNGTNGVSSTLNDERLFAIAEANGHNNLTLFGWPDEDGDGMVNYSEYWDNYQVATYRSLGISTMPAISIDEAGNMAIIYNVLSESRVDGSNNFYYRSAYMTFRDASGTWFYDHTNLSGDFIHSLDEVYSTTACPQGHNGEFWVAYSADETLGLFLDEDQSSLSDNVIWAVKVVPDHEGWGTHEAINPMTNISVRPNPVQDVMTLEINASQASNANVTIYNITGQVVAEHNINVSTGMNSRSINVENLNSGIYFVTVNANGFQETKKFVVR